jgi:hypothetical protein
MMCQCHAKYGGTPCSREATKDDELCDFCRNAHNERT